MEQDIRSVDLSKYTKYTDNEIATGIPAGTTPQVLAFIYNNRGSNQTTSQTTTQITTQITVYPIKRSMIVTQANVDQVIKITNALDYFAVSLGGEALVGQQDNQDYYDYTVNGDTLTVLARTLPEVGEYIVFHYYDGTTVTTTSTTPTTSPSNPSTPTTNPSNPSTPVVKKGVFTSKFSSPFK